MRILARAEITEQLIQPHPSLKQQKQEGKKKNFSTMIEMMVCTREAIY